MSITSSQAVITLAATTSNNVFGRLFDQQSIQLSGLRNAMVTTHPTDQSNNRAELLVYGRCEVETPISIIGDKLAYRVWVCRKRIFSTRILRLLDRAWYMRHGTLSIYLVQVNESFIIEISIYIIRTVMPLVVVS